MIGEKHSRLIIGYLMSIQEFHNENKYYICILPSFDFFEKIIKKENIKMINSVIYY
jgi:hypothetical protein